MFFSNKLNLIRMFGTNFDEEIKENDMNNNMNNDNNNNMDNENNNDNINNYKKIFDFNSYDFNDNIALNLLNITYKLYNSDNNCYKLLNYKKNYLNDNNIDSIGKFRSILIENNNIIMFSLPKSLSFSIFINKYKDIEKECIAEEIIEGTMINLFFTNDKWEISTKSTYGGHASFFKQFDTSIYNETDKNKTKTFRDMFFEVINSVNLDINLLNKDYCYSFVMQHTDNRIVLPIYSMNLYLIKVYKIDNINKIVYEINYKRDDHLMNCLKNTSIKFPIQSEIETFDKLKEKYSSEDLPFNTLGVMIYSPDGSRTKLRNKVYEELKELRGNQPKLQYHYLMIRKKGDNYIKKYLHYFQEHTDLFDIYKMQLYNYTYNLYENYVKCYIKKEKKLNEYPNNYKSCMYLLHIEYLNNLRPQNKYITLSNVIEYVNNLDPKLQMYYLNYDMRQKNLFINMNNIFNILH